jgi:enoyl-CoA hydratase
MPEYNDILFERLGHVARISHNRPRQRNAENTTLLSELDAALIECAADESVRVVILAATGDHFSAGHDLKEGQGRSQYSVEQRWEYEVKNYLGYCLNIWDFPKPTIAQVQGACIAGGFMVANMCDLMVAADDAYFQDPVVHSLSTAAVEVLIHPWVLGMRKAKEMLFTGERVTAAQGEQWGMVNRVVPRAELEAATLKLAERIAENAGTFSVMLTKRSLNRQMDMQGFRAMLSAHFDTHQLSHMSHQYLAIREKGLMGSIDKAKAAGKD